MSVSFDNVSLEDIKQQLKLLGHHVPDDLVTAYLREVQENSQATNSRGNSAEVQQPGSDLNAAAADTETADSVQPHNLRPHGQEIAVNGELEGTSTPRGDFRGQACCCISSACVAAASQAAVDS